MSCKQRPDFTNMDPQRARTSRYEGVFFAATERRMIRVVFRPTFARLFGRPATGSKLFLILTELFTAAQHIDLSFPFLDLSRLSILTTAGRMAALKCGESKTLVSYGSQFHGRGSNAT